MYFLHEKRPQDDKTDDNLSCTFCQSRLSSHIHHTYSPYEVRVWFHNQTSQLWIPNCTQSQHWCRCLPMSILSTHWHTMWWLVWMLDRVSVPDQIFILTGFHCKHGPGPDRQTGVLASLLDIRTILGPPPKPPVELAGETRSPSGRKSPGGHYHLIRTRSQPQQCPTLLHQFLSPSLRN